MLSVASPAVSDIRIEFEKKSQRVPKPNLSLSTRYMYEDCFGIEIPRIFAEMIMLEWSCR